MTKPKVYSYFDPPYYEPVYTEEDECPSLTQQQFAADADINNIMAKYSKTGCLVDPILTPSRKPSFGDFSGVPEFQAAQDLLAQSFEAFDAMPSHLRARFSNDPVNLLAFLEDPSNRDEAVRLGICSFSPEEEISSVPSGNSEE